MDFLLDIPMCAYNHEKYIAQAIEGVVMQKTNFKFRMFIGEDASIDNTRNIIIEYSLKYPNIIFPVLYDINIGATENSKILVSKCTSKYIALCDGDDYWTDPYKLQKQVDFLERNPDYGMVYTNHSLYFQKSGKFKKANDSRPECISGNVFEKLLIKNFISTLTVVMNLEILKTTLDKLKLDEKKWLMGDYPMSLEIARHHKIGYINEDTAVYRIHSNSLTRISKYQGSLDFINSYHDIQKYFIDNYPVSSAVVEQIETEYHKASVIFFFLLNQKDSFKTSYLFLKGKLNRNEAIKFYIFNLGLKNRLFQILIFKFIDWWRNLKH